MQDSGSDQFERVNRTACNPRCGKKRFHNRIVVCRFLMLADAYKHAWNHPLHRICDKQQQYEHIKHSAEKSGR